MVLCAGMGDWGHVYPPLKCILPQHDNNKDGYLTKDEVIQLSESLLVNPSLFRRMARK